MAHGNIFDLFATGIERGLKEEVLPLVFGCVNYTHQCNIHLVFPEDEEDFGLVCVPVTEQGKDLWG